MQVGDRLVQCWPLFLTNPLEDRRYRNSVVYYNELRKHYLNESMEEAEVSLPQGAKS